jgi:branched-chain amino acid aminotransferase
MANKAADVIWMNGELVKWEDAKIHILSHVIHYGSSVFEGMRIYSTPDGPRAFRLKEHTDRLFNSAKIYRMDVPYSKEEINTAILNLPSANGFGACYVRPLVYRGFGRFGVDPTGTPIEVAIAVWPWGQYLGAEALENGVAVGFSSWNRMAPNTMPAMAKSSGNYLNSQLIKLEAIQNGYVEGIALDTHGCVSEGSGENVFIVYEGKIITPTFTSSILPGITRKTIITLANDLGYDVLEQNIPREMVYLADEVFFTGSAAEVTPISSVDRIRIGEGKAGPITKKLQKAFFDVVEGRVEDKYGWLTPVPTKEQVAAK